MCGTFDDHVGGIVVDLTGLWREWQLMAPRDPNLLSVGNLTFAGTGGVGPDDIYQESRAGVGR